MLYCVKQKGYNFTFIFWDVVRLILVQEEVFAISMKSYKYIKLIFQSMWNDYLNGVSCFPYNLPEGSLWVRIGCKPASRETYTVTGVWGSQLSYISYQKIAKVGVQLFLPFPFCSLWDSKSWDSVIRIQGASLLSYIPSQMHPELCPLHGSKSSHSDNQD